MFIQDSFTPNTVLRMSIGAIAIVSLQGCLLTSPYYGQEFASKSTVIPVQAWTTKTSEPVKLECALSGRFGPAPFGGSIPWQFVKNMTVGNVAAVDTYNTPIYGASSRSSMPESCWRTVNTSSGIRHYTALRATQTNYLSTPLYQFMNFKSSGLECLGTEVGKARSWLGWSGKDCVTTYSNSTTPIPFVVIKAL